MSRTRKLKKARKKTRPQGVIYAALLPDGMSEFSEDQIRAWAADFHQQLLSARNRDSLEDGKEVKR